MKRWLQAVIAAGILSIPLSISSYVMPEFICVILSLFLYVALIALLLVSLYLGYARWRKACRLWFGPSAVCLGVLMALHFASALGDVISDRMFEKHIDEYHRVVNGVRNGSLSCAAACNAELAMIEARIRPPYIQEVLGARCNDGGIIVLFLVDTDVPGLHEGYFFKDYGKSSDCNVRSVSPELGWPHVPYIRHITGQWYRFSDQPGL